MKNLFKNFIKKVNTAKENVVSNVQEICLDKRGEGFIDKGVWIVVILALAVVVTGALINAWDNTIIPNLGTKITEIFAL